MEEDVVQLEELEVNKMKGEVGAFFQMGTTGITAWNSFIKKQYLYVQDWSLKLKFEPDNLEYIYNRNYYRTRYGQYMKLYSIARQEDMVANAKRYEIEAAKDQEEKLK
jgi:hypothetical protein